MGDDKLLPPIDISNWVPGAARLLFADEMPGVAAHALKMMAEAVRQSAFAEEDKAYMIKCLTEAHKACQEYFATGIQKGNTSKLQRKFTAAFCVTPRHGGQKRNLRQSWDVIDDIETIRKSRQLSLDDAIDIYLNEPSSIGTRWVTSPENIKDIYAQYFKHYQDYKNQIPEDG